MRSAVVCGLSTLPDDLDLMAESEDKLMEEFELWRSGTGGQGFES